LLLVLLLSLVSLLLLASRLWKAFLLLLASFKFLMVSCCWSLCYCKVPGVTEFFKGRVPSRCPHGFCSVPPVVAFLLLASRLWQAFLLLLAVLLLLASCWLMAFLLLLASLLILVSLLAGGFVE
jgi:hypothetical protein